MKAVKRIYYWSAIYGIVVLAPMLFLEQAIGRDFPPATNHPEQYYGFVALALAWQIVFLLIARDPVRYRPLMPVTMLEKFLPGGLALWLWLQGRVPVQQAAPFFGDLVIGALFVAAYRRMPRD